MNVVYDVAERSGLFAEGDIKVRLRSYHHYKLGKGKSDFIHVFGYIMEGRSVAQKAALSRSIIETINALFPAVPIVSMNISEFEATTYSNKSLIHSDNHQRDRHFLH